MGNIFIKTDAILNARPEDVYSSIADYRNGHPNIVPRENMYNFRVEEGGYGEGTVVHFTFKALGVERVMSARISEPQPGRVLVERDVDSVNDVITTFRVTPVEDGKKSHVEISTSYKPSPGLMGLIERMTIPRINPKIYQKELQILEAFAQKKHSTV